MATQPAIGASGFLGYAVEAVSGTYLAPTDYVPIISENLQYMQDTNFRRPIRQASGIVGATAGPMRVEGEIQMEAFENHITQFLRAARVGIVKSGTTPNFTYTFTGDAKGVAAKTLSITVARSDQVFAYTGCTVGGFTFSIEDATLMFNAKILGLQEASQSMPTATWLTTDEPYGAGKYVIEIPTAAQVFDVDEFEFTVEDNAEVQFRLKDVLSAQFTKFGEREVTLELSRDFLTRADYDAYKALTAQSITLKATKGANNSIHLIMPASIKDEYTLGLEGQGELIRSTISYRGVLDAVGNDYQVVVKTQKDITPP